jgi:hypothetical protein
MAGNPGQNPNDLLLNELAGLKNAQLEAQAKLERLENLEQSFKQQQVTAQIDTGIKELYREVGDFSKNHPEYQTSIPFEQIDDIVSTNDEDVAKTMVSPEDWERYSAVMEVVGLYKNNKAGKFELTNKNFDDLNEAFLIHQKRNGKLGQAQAEAKRQGIQAYESSLQKAAQSAKSLPNSLSSAQAPEMGQAQIEHLLNLSPEQLSSDPELKKQFDQAVAQLGINLNAMPDRITR